jgi:hypothetical protein
MNKNTTPIEVIEYLTNYFETFGNLPTPVIECQASGTAYTAFGTNLKNKVAKAGGIKELLTTFQGRGVAKKEKKQEVKSETKIEKRTKKAPIKIKAQDLEKAKVTLSDLTPVTE